MPTQPEVWLRGPLAGVHAALQPVAHALLQAKEEVQSIMEGFPEDLLWYRPASLASVAFHLQHLVGVLDRLFTYASGKSLNEAQLTYLKGEGAETPGANKEILVSRFISQVNMSVTAIKEMNPDTLYEFRGVGRAQLPSTTAGLLFHAAEHTMRHVGQLLVTVRILTHKSEGKDI